MEDKKNYQVYDQRVGDLDVVTFQELHNCVLLFTTSSDFIQEVIEFESALSKALFFVEKERRYFNFFVITNNPVSSSLKEMLSEEGGLKDLKQDIPFIFDEKNELGTLFGVYDENCKEEYNAYIGIGLHGEKIFQVVNGTPDLVVDLIKQCLQ